MTAMTRRMLLAAASAAAAITGFVPVAWAAVRGRVVGVINTANSKAPDGAATPVVVGGRIDDGVAIETGKDSAVELALELGGAFIIGARSTVAFSEAVAVMMQAGRFRYVAAADESYGFQSPTLDIVQTAADFVVEVRPNGDTICGVMKGAIVCTSKRGGRVARVGAGQSVVWAGGSFGSGVTEGVYRTGDVAVDQGMDAARANRTP